MKLMQVIPVNITQSCETFMYFINLPYNYALFRKIYKNQIVDHKILILMGKNSIL